MFDPDLTGQVASPDELLRRACDRFYELVDGRLKSVDSSVLASWVGGELAARLGNHVEAHHLGWVFPSSMFCRCFPWQTDLVRKPDVTFLRAGRVSAEFWGEDFLTEPPDLAVEVVSPNDLASELLRKIGEYLRAGVLLIWVIDPEARQAQVFRKDLSANHVPEHGELDGEDVIPGFQVRLSALWPVSLADHHEADQPPGGGESQT